ncbi:MAG TPA: excalibur calcium-binding domain-containing protein [Arenimonas sp.]
MRRHGNLIRWNEDRGFGFIAPAGSDTELFVHISAFPRGSKRPEPGELLSFEVEKGDDGRDRAVRIYRAGQTGPVTRPGGQPQRRGPRYLSQGALALVLLIAGIWAVVVWRGADPTAPRSAAVALPLVAEQPAERFQCDGRMHCSQMKSCAEATYFIRNCPDTRMDGDRDGIPCESQHCY